VKLSWTATGDDGNAGTATLYDIRYSTTALNASNFDLATQLTGEPAPAPANTPQEMNVTGLSFGIPYNFAMKVTDNASNVSGLSNVASINVPSPDTTPPAAVTTLAAGPAYSYQVVTANAIASSGDVNSTYSKEKSTDLNAATSWSTPPRTTMQTEYLTVDLGLVRAVGRIRLLSRDVAGALFPEDFQIQVSSDNVNYSTLQSAIGFVAANGTWYTFDTFTPAPGRYVRLYVTKARLYPVNNSYWVQLAELEVSEGVQVFDRARLTWTATGDDGSSGIAASYDVRYSTTPLTDANFASATQAADEPAPASPGSTQQVTVTGLTVNTTYHFGLKVADDSGNVSGLSNIAQIVLSSTDVTAPAAIADLAAAPAYSYQVASATAIASSGDVNATYSKEKATDANATTSWSTPSRPTMQIEYLTVDLGSNQLVGRVRLLSRDVTGELFPEDFQIQVSTDNVNYTTLQSVTGATSPAGTWHTYQSFAPTTGRYVRLWVTKARLYSGNNQYWVQLGEVEVSRAIQVAGQANLTWTAPGDDGNTGTATAYDIHYSSAAITTEAQFTAATPVSNPPAPSAGGAPQSFTVTGLGSGTYYFAIKARDEANNTGPLSNSPSITLP
jgi:hypothetical protein